MRETAAPPLAARPKRDDRRLRGRGRTRAGRRAYLGDTVYEALRAAILGREFDPGEPLTELELSRRFGTSRTPVREALAKLERDRLVQVVPKKGAFVRTVSHDEIRDLYQVREALEGLAVRLAAPRLDPGALRTFAGRFRELRARGPRTPYTEVRALGREFHRYLLDQCGNRKLGEILEEIGEQIRPVWTMSILGARRVQGVVQEHIGVIEAIERGDVRRAERLMVAHVRRVRETIFRLLD
jgi:DNA-binding GntR family transcriptional regulator